MKHPTIKRVSATTARRLLVEWSTGERHTIDLSEPIRRARALHPLAKPAVFGAVKRGAHGHSVRWSDQADIGADTLRRLALEQSGGFTSPDDFVAWRASLGLSLSDAARALGLSRRMLGYYESGERPIPRIVALACRGYQATALSPTLVRSRSRAA